MKLGGKWIDGIRPEGSVAEAARLSLSARLATVGHWLPLAADHPEDDIEYVHQLRVSTRRAMAALVLYGDWLPARPTRWLKKRLRKIRRAAGAARDLDVLAERLRRELGGRGEGLLAEIAYRRADAQPAIVEVAERARHNDRVARKVRKLLDGIRPPGGTKARGQPADFRSWARAQLTQMAAEFFAILPPGNDDEAALHELRLRGKALRYAIELLAPAFGPELRRKHYPVVEDLQERLGRVNDYAVGGQKLAQWAAKTHNDADRDALRRLAEVDAARLAQEIDAFHQWWTPDRIENLRQGLMRIENEGL